MTVFGLLQPTQGIVEQRDDVVFLQIFRHLKELFQVGVAELEHLGYKSETEF
jgi:hypothetical protein